jgi:pimeloyl-ACP methyl ester carboxylesterase
LTNITHPTTVEKEGWEGQYPYKFPAAFAKNEEEVVSMLADALCHDVSPLDEQYPATLIPLTFESHEQQLVGRIYVAQGAGPHPTILLLHGFPGDEQNGDLAHILRRAGWNVMTFHYRGAWGSQGSFSFTHVFEDIPVALDLLRTHEMRERCRVDAERIVLIGHSMGGFGALLTAAADSSVLAVASLAGFHFGAFARLLRQDASLIESTVRDWNTCLPALRGISAEQLVQEVLDQSEQWTLDQYLQTLAQRSVFLLGASRDTVAPLHLHHTPLVAALERLSASHVRSAILHTDHAFSDARVALAQHLLSWLDEVKRTERTA